MKLFISYRRKSWPFAQRLAEALGERLNAEIFIDITGVDDSHFERAILANLRESDAVLLIVTEYTFSQDRIFDTDDWVRREIRESLVLDKPVVMALVDNQTPPDNIPEDIKDIQKRQGIEFYSRYFLPGVDELVTLLEKVSPLERKPAPVVNHTIGRPPDPAHPDIERQRAMYGEASTLMAEGQPCEAERLFRELAESGYKPRYGDIETRLEEAEQLCQQFRLDAEAQAAYDDLALFVKGSQTPESKDRAWAAWQQFQRTYPFYDDDPHQIEAQFQERMITEPPHHESNLPHLQNGNPRITSTHPVAKPKLTTLQVAKPTIRPRPHISAPVRVVLVLAGLIMFGAIPIYRILTWNSGNWPPLLSIGNASMVLGLLLLGMYFVRNPKPIQVTLFVVLGLLGNVAMAFVPPPALLEFALFLVGTGALTALVFWPRLR